MNKKAFDIDPVVSFFWVEGFAYWQFKGIEGGPGPKIYISFILIYVIALSFFFPKWGHTLLNYCYFWFYVHLREGGIVKYRGKRTL